jgi:hypothetical protein
VGAGERLDAPGDGGLEGRHLLARLSWTIDWTTMSMFFARWSTSRTSIRSRSSASRRSVTSLLTPTTPMIRPEPRAAAPSPHE